MKEIKVLGPGCAKCKKLEENTRIALEELGWECEFEKVTDVQEMLQYGVMMTPALVVDGKVLLSGKAASPNYVKKLLTQTGEA